MPTYNLEILEFQLNIEVLQSGMDGEDSKLDSIQVLIPCLESMNDHIQLQLMHGHFPIWRENNALESY